MFSTFLSYVFYWGPALFLEHTHIWTKNVTIFKAAVPSLSLSPSVKTY